MAIYKENEKYIVKVCINGKQILRRKYLGKTILTKDNALACEKDLYISYGDLQKDYEINDLFNIYEEYLFKRYKETSSSTNITVFNKHIKKYFIDRKVSSITRSYLNYVCDSLNAQAYKDIHKLIFVAQSFINFLNLYGLKESSNILFVYKTNRIKKRNSKKIWTGEDFNKFYFVLETTEEKLLFSLLFYYGLRIGELRALKVEDFLSDRVYIYKELTNKTRLKGQKVLSTKTNSSVRYYPYVNNIKELKDLLIKEKKLKKNDFIFMKRINKIDYQNKVIGETTIRRLIHKYTIKAGLDLELTPHEFRHSCVSFLINKNVDIKYISSWVGHSSTKTTESIYGHILPIKKEQVAKEFSNFDTIDTIFNETSNKKTR